MEAFIARVTKTNSVDWAIEPRSSFGARPSFWPMGSFFLQEAFGSWPIKVDFKLGQSEGKTHPKDVYLVLRVLNEQLGFFDPNFLFIF